MSRYNSGDGAWCRVEIMGHVEHVGRATEVDMVGGKMLRVCDETESEPIFYGLGAIFSIRWLSDEEGRKESERRHAAWEEQGKRHERGRVIGGIQETIRTVLRGTKMTPWELQAFALKAHPSMSDADYAEAVDGMMLDEIEVDGIKMLWIDPDGMPF